MNMCNLFLFHLQDHFHWFKFPVRFNGKIKHGWRIRLWIYERTQRHSHGYARMCWPMKTNGFANWIQSKCAWAHVSVLCWTSLERKDRCTLYNWSNSIYLFATSTSLFCHIENFMQNKQTVFHRKKNFGEFFLWLNLFLPWHVVVSHKRKWR